MNAHKDRVLYKGGMYNRVLVKTFLDGTLFHSVIDLVSDKELECLKLTPAGNREVFRTSGRKVMFDN